MTHGCLARHLKTKSGQFSLQTGMLQVFGVNDHGSTQLLSSLLGQITVVLETLNRALDAAKSGITFGLHHVDAPLLTPDEMRHLPDRAALLFLGSLQENKAR